VVGDPREIKGTLVARGIRAELDYVAEGFTDRGGTESRDDAWEDRAEALVRADLGQLAGLSDTKVQMRTYLVVGEGLSSRALGNRFAVSSIEAPPGIHVFDAWLEKRFPDWGISIRAGRLAADDEFMISRTAANFVNGTFGWPAIAALDLAEGGPAYPSARLGMRVRYSPQQDRALLVGTFEVPDGVDPALRPPGGADGHRLLTLAEEQISGPGGEAAADTTLKLGAWLQTKRFARSGDSNRMAAAGSVSGFGLYGLLDRNLWHSADGTENIAAFTRAVIAPQSDNPFRAYIDAGLGVTGLLPSRRSDFLGIAAAYGRAMGSLPTDRDALNVALEAHEFAVEISYAASLSPWCALQPDVQYLHYTVPAIGPATVRSTVVLGIRASLRIW
jgi:porin